MEFIKKNKNAALGITVGAVTLTRIWFFLFKDDELQVPTTTSI